LLRSPKAGLLPHTVEQKHHFGWVHVSCQAREANGFANQKKAPADRLSRQGLGS
jgi:desulfoferrodoxin (superoxide reductase-like protein)